jgi:hypothetical protein
LAAATIIVICEGKKALKIRTTPGTYEAAMVIPAPKPA